MYPLSFSLDAFLSEFWQKKPTIIKAGFNDFIDPISPDELAGLAMEDVVDSRYITNANNQWQAQHGPFDETLFEQLPETHWQLIVQACNHWHTGSAELLESFKAMPQWLFDDLMVCYSAQGGGVGPHIDQYDVFIIQGSGKRHWRVGDLDQGQYQEKIEAGALRQIEHFNSIIDDILEPGDILYIPPGFPHEGTTLEPSLSYSVGYRSPTEQELLSNFADHAIASEMGEKHWHNPDLTVRKSHSIMTSDDLSQLTAMLKACLESEQHIEEFMGTMLSQSRHQLDIVENEEQLTSDDVFQHLDAMGCLRKVSGLKTLYHENSIGTLFVNGEKFTLVENPQALTQLLCDTDEVSLEQIHFPMSEATLALLTELVNKGYWFLD